MRHYVVRAAWSASLLAVLLVSGAAQAAEAPPEGSAAANLEISIAKIKDTLKRENQGKTNVVSSSLLQQSSQVPEAVAASGGRMLKGLCLCVGMFLIGTSLLRRMRGHRGGSTDSLQQLTVLARRPLTPKTSLMLVEADGQSVLVAVGPDRVSFCGLQQPAAQPVVQAEAVEEKCGEALKLSA